MDRRTQVLFGAAAGIALLFWFAVVAPLHAATGDLRKSMPQYRKDLHEMQGLHRTFQQLRVDAQELERRIAERPENFALFAFVSGVAKQQGLTLASLQPSARPVGDRWQLERVEVKLEGVSFRALVSLLQALTDPAHMVHIDRFVLRGGREGLNVTFEAQTLTLRS